MSKMTSSSVSDAAEALSKRPVKMLTDFSIETIIRGQPNFNYSQQDELIKLAHQKDQEDLIDATDPNEHHMMTTEQQQQAATTQSNCNHHHQHIQDHQQQQRKVRPKNFQCTACKMAFSNNGQLKNHVRIHTGERPFMCNHQGCKKTFTRNEELTRHKLIHTGVRPHACTSCGKRFGRKDHLKKHVRTHERKRLRKKVFVPRVASFIADDDVFVPPKPANNGLLQARNELRLRTHMSPAVATTVNISSTLSATSNLIPNTIGPTGSAHHQLTPTPASMAFPLHQSVAAIAAAAVATTTTSSTTTNATSVPMQTNAAIQQLASDYWYNLIGLYQNHQHHHYPEPSPVDRLAALGRNMFRRRP